VQGSTGSTWSGGSRTCLDAPCRSSQVKLQKQRFLIIGRSHLGQPVPAEILPPELLERLVLYGALTTLDGAEPDGVALAVQAPDREAVGAFVDDERTGLDAFSEVEVHNWEFSGRR
jgi:hypothetical protein